MAETPRILPLAALSLFLLPASIDAQEAPRPMYELPSITVSVISEADPLYEKASGLFQAGDWNGAAELYRTTAEDMPRNDPNSYPTYDMSARLYFYAGEYRNAREMMERAAEVAKSTGDVVSAAYRHVDAGFIAVWEGFPGKRREHVKAAETYAQDENFGEYDAARIVALTRGVSVLPVEEDE